MVSGLVLLLVVADAAPSAEVRGETLPMEERRSRPRGSLAFATGLSLVSWEGEPALGPGAIFEAGLIFNDRLALSLHLESTLLLPAAMEFKPRGLTFLGGATAEWFFTDRWSGGVGCSEGRWSAPAERRSCFPCARAGG